MRKTFALVFALAIFASILSSTVPALSSVLSAQSKALPAAATVKSNDADRHITTLPYFEDFEGAAFPPANWQVFNPDGQQPQWASSTAYNHSSGGFQSAVHTTSTGAVYSDGWLVTPLVDIPNTGTTLSFWSYNLNPGSYDSNSIQISTGDPDPDVGDYIPIWSPLTVSDRWVFNQVDITPWRQQSVYIAFRYQGANAHDWYLDDVTIEEAFGIYNFPWEENFESGVFPPYYWGYFDQDGTGENWLQSWSMNHSEDGICCAEHQSNAASNQDGWLVTPLLWIPAGAAYMLSFWSYNNNPGAYGSNSVLLSTGSNVPADGDYFPIWSPITVSDEWTYNMVDITPWSGMPVFIAFRYQGIAAHDWFLDDVRVQEYTGISEFPLTENFESGIFPPYYWSQWDLDGSGTYWSWNQNFNHSNNGTCSAMHIWDNEEPAEDGWLLSPRLDVPAGSNFSVSFWSYNVNPQWYGNNSVLVSNASFNPADGDFVQVWSPATVSEEWVFASIDLSAWSGQSICVAFRYQGFDAHDWYLDDISFEAVSEDNTPPTISHLPLLNTLRDDVGYGIYAEAVDDPVWNSGIAYVGVFYKLNAGDWIWQVLAPQGEGWFGEIPAQPHGTQITYVLVACDNNNNLTYSPGYSFWVDDPVWLYYDSLSLNTWAGWNMSSWGLGVIFSNPLYDTGEPLKVNKVTACFMEDNTVNLKIFSFDDIDFTNYAPVMPPLSLFFGSEAWSETTLQDVFVTTPYFMVVYDGIDPWNGFAADNQRYYPGMCRMELGDGIFQDLDDLGFNGAWMLRIEVQSAGFISAPLLTIVNSDDGPVLHWTAVEGADHYNVYASADPAAPAPWSLFDTTEALEMGALGDAAQNFFRVTAVAGETRVSDLSNPLKANRAKTGRESQRKVPYKTLTNNK